MRTVVKIGRGFGVGEIGGEFGLIKGWLESSVERGIGSLKGVVGEDY